VCSHCNLDKTLPKVLQIKVLCYKPEDRWFDPRWCHWNLSLT